jgi:hypothetical protein
MLVGVLDLMKRRYDQAISEGQRAVALAPNLTDGYFWLGDILIYSGRPMEAVVAAVVSQFEFLMARSSVRNFWRWAACPTNMLSTLSNF